MSDHPELDIMDRAVELLLAANTDAGTHVYPTRKTNFRRNELPAIGVYTLSTDGAIRTIAPRGYRNQAVLVCEIWMESGLAIDTAFRPLMKLEYQVKRALAFNVEAFEDLGCVSEFEFTDADRILNPSGERATGESMVSFLVTYDDEAETDPSAVPFNRARTAYDIDGNTDPGNQPQDQVNLEGATP